MVTHEESLNTAFRIMSYSLLWLSIGGIMIFIGGSIIGQGMISALTGRIDFNTFNPVSATIALAMIIFGYLIAIAGPLAAFIKGLTDLILENIE